MTSAAQRASSLGISALIVGGALVLALSATVSVSMHPFGPEIPDIPMVRPPPEPPPPQPTPHPLTAPPPTAPTQPVATQLLPPANPVPDAPGLVDFAGPPTPGPVEIANPFWRHRPTDLGRFYPARALQRSVEGRAVLDCQVSTTGALSCSVVSETPSGWGFGAAALQIAAQYAMEPATRDGRPVIGRYRMVVPFALR